MRRLALALFALAPLGVAGCGSNEADETVAEPTPTPTVAAPRTLVAADFAPESLGAKIDGPQGPEPEAAIMAEGREIGRIKSFVACPKDTAECVPGEMPEGTKYTYVHEVTLDEDIAPADGDGAATSGTGAAAQTAGALFRMTRPAAGFNRSVGYSRAQAEEALGRPDAITVTVDEEQIIWRVTGGSGWKPGQAIAFWWQSTLPPEGPADAYRLEAQGMTASARGPFPPAQAPVERAPAS